MPKIGAAVAALLLATPALTEPVKLRNASVEKISFGALDGWTNDDLVAAYASFTNSCKAILQGTKAMRHGRPIYAGLFEVCLRASSSGKLDNEHARKFFESNFQPVKVTPFADPEGPFFTGYYETEFEGSRFPSDVYNVPIYAKPSNLVMPTNPKARPGRRLGRKKVVPYYSRNEIEDGILAGRGLEICWVKNPVDAFFAQIQGSSRVKLDTGETIRLNYDAHNGMNYVPVGKFLIQRGIVSKEEMSMDKIREFMEKNPEEGKELRRKNQSFVFFREVRLADHEEGIGAQGIPLSAGRSIAVDKNIHTYGTPVWIEGEFPIDSEKPETRFRHLLIAQDTGSAIIGPARADIYFGAGEEVGHAAGRMKQHGKFVMLVPRTVAIAGDVKEVPLPKIRPLEAPERPADEKSETATKTPDVVADAVDHLAVPLPKPRKPGT
ncbi:MAG: MltA domain-containing protein [Pseudolabrys sp.]|nr:MltA domain-containing protein [Pseudolabrys sp.]